MLRRMKRNTQKENFQSITGRSIKRHEIAFMKEWVLVHLNASQVITIMGYVTGIQIII